MWIKRNGKWISLQREYDSLVFKGNLVGSNLFSVNSNDDNAILYTAASTLDDIFEEHRNFCNNTDKLNDPYGFWIVGYFDSDKVISAKFYNRNFVKAASSDTTKFDSALQRSSIDYITLSNTFDTLSVDGVKLFNGDRVLLKNQAYETLTPYTFTKISAKHVRITDTTPATKYKYFAEGNEVVFVDVSNNAVLYDTISNLKTYIEFDGVDFVNYVSFDVQNEIPDTATKVADRIDGLYTLTDQYIDNGIYVYSNKSLTRADDLSDADNRLNYLVWAEEGDTNKDNHYYLQRKSNGTYPIPNTDKLVFAKGDIHVIGHNLSYTLNQTTPDYSSYKYKFLILDQDLATKLSSIDLDGRISSTYKDGNGRVYSVPVTISNFDSTSIAGNTVEFSKTYNSVDNIIAIEDITRYNKASVKPSGIFTSIQGSGLSFKQQSATQADDISQNPGRIHLTANTIDFSAVAGDIVRVEIVSSGTTILDETFVVQDYINVMISGTVNMLMIYPILPNELISELNIAANFTLTVTNLSMYRNMADLIDSFNMTYLGKYYTLSANGTTLQFDFSNKDDSKYKYLETTVTFQSTGHDLLSPTPSIYGNQYSVEKLLTPVNAIFDSSYNFSTSELPQHTYTYNNVAGSTRFGILYNRIMFGSSFTVDYKKNTWISLTYPTVSDFRVFILDIIQVGDETHLVIDYNFDPANPASETIPSATQSVVVNSVINLFDISTLLKERADDAKYRAGQDSYAQVMLRDNNFRSYVTGVLWRDEKGIMKCGLSKNTAATTNSDDLRRTFTPFEIMRVGSDGLSTPALLLNDGDWFEGDNGEIVISPSSEASKRIRFIDGLTEEKIRGNIDGQGFYSWILAPDVIAINAVVGREINNTSPSNQSRLVWYTGEWRNGTFKDGLWYSGTWKKGTWESGEWNSYYVIDNGNTMNVIKTNSKDEFSVWTNGTWVSGIWNAGTWKNGTWTAGTHKDGLWLDGTWLNGTWNNGIWEKGTWTNGFWFGGEFETGTWLNGTWDDSLSVTSRFGTKATLTDRAIWYGGNWNGGEFYSGYNSLNGVTIPSSDHRCSIWWNGTWNSGIWWGGSFVAGSWKGGTWEDGVWLGGYPVTSVTHTSDTVKTLTLDITRWDTILGLGANTSHRFKLYENVVIIGAADAETALTAGLANEIIENDNGSLSTVKKQITAATSTTIDVSWNGTSSDVSTTSWVTEDGTNKIPSGGPYVASVWENGTWKRGVWINGVFAAGNFQSGLWGQGLFIGGIIGSSADTFVAK